MIDYIIKTIQIVYYDDEGDQLIFFDSKICPPYAVGQTIFIDIDDAYQKDDVWINGDFYEITKVDHDFCLHHRFPRLVINVHTTFEHKNAPHIKNNEK